MPPKVTVSKSSSSKSPKGDEEKDVKIVRSKKGKPLTPYLFFCHTFRDEIKEKNPDISFADLGKEFGRRWKLLSDDEKAGYKQ